MAVSSPLPHNNFKQCHQASAPGGLWVRWKQVEGLCQSWGSCQTDQDRQTQSSVEALCSAPSKTRAQGRRPVIQTMCGASLWAREVVGRARKNGTKLPSYFQIAFFLIQHSHGCCKTLFSGIMTVDSYSFCLFFLLFFFFPEGRESLEPSTPPFLIKSLPLLLLSTPKYHRVSTECSEFCLLSHVHNYILSDWPNTLTNKNEHGGHCFKMTE